MKPIKQHNPDDVVQLDYLEEEGVVKLNLPSDIIDRIKVVIITRNKKEQVAWAEMPVTAENLHHMVFSDKVPKDEPHVQGTDGVVHKIVNIGEEK